MDLYGGDQVGAGRVEGGATARVVDLQRTLPADLSQQRADLTLGDRPDVPS